MAQEQKVPSLSDPTKCVTQGERNCQEKTNANPLFEWSSGKNKCDCTGYKHGGQCYSDCSKVDGDWKNKESNKTCEPLTAEEKCGKEQKVPSLSDPTKCVTQRERNCQEKTNANPLFEWSSGKNKCDCTGYKHGGQCYSDCSKVDGDWKNKEI